MDDDTSTMAGAPAVVIATADAPLARSVRRALATEPFRVVDEAVDATSAVTAVGSHRPDVCLVDIALPGGGVRAVEEVTTTVPSVLSVMIGDSPSDDELFGSMYAGASGFLPRDLAADRWGVALASLLDGEALLPRSLTTRLVEEFRARERRKRLSLRGRPGVDLTSREWVIVHYVEEDLTTADIAERLFITPATVRSHLSTVMRKLGVPDRRALRRLLQDR